MSSDTRRGQTLRARLSAPVFVVLWDVLVLCQNISLAADLPLRPRPPVLKPRPEARCDATASDRLADHLETYVFIVPRKPPACPSGNCCLVPHSNVLINIGRNESRSIVIRSVYFDALNKPKKGVPLIVSPISTTGSLLENFLIVQPQLPVTDDEGFASVTVTIDPSADRLIKLFRLRVDFKDRELQTYSISGPILITD